MAARLNMVRLYSYVYSDRVASGISTKLTDGLRVASHEK